MNNEEQVILISSKLKGQRLTYEVEKQGVMVLRKYKNKKFRVIFNILPSPNCHFYQNRSIAIFNNNLLNSQNSKTIQQKTLKSNQNKKYENCLTISTSTKQISQNRLIVILNAYLNQKQSPKIVILGYLISSLVFYHNWTNQFSQQSLLTRLFCQFGKLLRQTDIEKLNQNIKYKTGYNKTPYFLCLIGKDQSDKSGKQYQNYLNEFYRFQSQKQNSKINYALQTIIDYFPQRSSLGVQGNYKNKKISFNQNGLNQIKQLGKQFEQNILGRKLFNFEFTGTTIQNLVFELCQCFNQQHKINLVDIYNKVILNKKSRIQTQSLQHYLNLVQKHIFYNKRIDFDDNSFLNKYGSNSIFPISQSQLNQIQNQLRNQVLKQAQTQALNCMNLEEYLMTKQKITAKIKQYEIKLGQLNSQLGSKFVDQCYQILDFNQQQIQFYNKNDGQIVSSQNVKQIFSFFINKISSFSDQCVSLFTQQDNNSTLYNQKFLKLINNYFHKIQSQLSKAFTQIQMSKRKDKLQIQTLRYQLKKCQSQKKKLQEKYQFQLLMQAQLKSKVQQFFLNDSSFSQSSLLKKQPSIYCNSKEFYRMKKIIEDLQEQVKDKNNHIEELTQIIQKFQPTSKMASSLTFYQKKNDKFNQSTQKLIAQANSKILKFYQIFQEVKNVQKQYENVKKSLLKERQKIIAQKKQNVKQIQTIKEKHQKTKSENQKLQQILLAEKKALEKFRQLQETLKQNIGELETNNCEITCALAEVQGQLESYKKALNLVVQQYMKGKSQNLQKFYKFLQHEKLKQLLKPILSKK